VSQILDVLIVPESTTRDQKSELGMMALLLPQWLPEQFEQFLWCIAPHLIRYFFGRGVLTLYSGVARARQMASVLSRDWSGQARFLPVISGMDHAELWFFVRQGHRERFSVRSPADALEKTSPIATSDVPF